MINRRILLVLSTLLPGAAFAGSGRAASSEAKTKVVYHLADREKVGFVLGNIDNHYTGVGGPDQVEIALVVHGPALKAFHVTDGDAKAIAGLDKLIGIGTKFHACANTMRAFGYKAEDLPKHMILASKGGVVRLTELQQQGYIYLRP